MSGRTDNGLARDVVAPGSAAAIRPFGGSVRAGLETMLDSLTQSEHRQVEHFLQSSAGELLMNVMPSGEKNFVPLTPAARDAAMAACGIR